MFTSNHHCHGYSCSVSNCKSAAPAGHELGSKSAADSERPNDKLWVGHRAAKSPAKNLLREHSSPLHIVRHNAVHPAWLHGLHVPCASNAASRESFNPHIWNALLSSIVRSQFQLQWAKLPIGHGFQLYIRMGAAVYRLAAHAALTKQDKMSMHLHLTQKTTWREALLCRWKISKLQQTCLVHPAVHWLCPFSCFVDCDLQGRNGCGVHLDELLHGPR